MKRKPIYCFIDASNLFYGGEKSLGWKIDYQKLIKYIRHKYQVTKVFYHGGVELSGFQYSILDNKPINLDSLIVYLRNKMKAKNISEGQIIILEKHIKRIKFYLKLRKFGYILILKPVKIFHEIDGSTVKKANCDVDMTFDMMRYINDYSGILILSGDGDFVIVLKYLKYINKSVTVLARGERTAREIRQLAAGNFRDFNRLRNEIEFIKK